MDKIKAFDEEIAKMYDYEGMMSKILYVMFAFFASVCMIFPFGGAKEDRIMAWMAFCLANMSVFQYLQPFMVVGKTSIYEKLKWLPVSKKEIREVRMGYLNKYCLKLFVIGVGLQQAASLLNHSFGLKSLLYPMILYLLVWLGGAVQIRLGFKR